MRFRRLTVPFSSSVRLTDELLSMLNDLVSNLANLFDRGIGFTDNMDCVSINFTSNVTPGTEDAIAHTLGRVPVGFIVTSMDQAAIVYRGATSFSATTIYLRTNTASVAVQALVF